MTVCPREPQRALLIPDVHQNVGWVRRVLAAEAGCDQVVFLGDYFDSRGEPESSIAATCRFLLELRHDWGDRVTFLLGNHDLQYLEAKWFCDRRRPPLGLRYQCGASYSQTTARKVARGLPAAFWAHARLFLPLEGFLLSHAGVAKAHWPGAATVEDSLQGLERTCRQALANLRGEPQPILLPGFCRGGSELVGGITWLDWHLEFDDDATPLPQIVGHTVDSQGARRRGRSWCLDGHQSTYGVLAAGELRVAMA